RRPTRLESDEDTEGNESPTRRMDDALRQELSSRSYVSISDEINLCQREIAKCNRRALKMALRAGELFIFAKETLERERWSIWLEKFIKLNGDQRRRYTYLARQQSYLDQQYPKWRKQMGIQDAISLLM